MIKASDVVVIDVRTPSEFTDGHIQGAQNININGELFVEKIGALDKNEKYIVNCQFGGRSSRATALMHELGFKNTFNLDGGIAAWAGAGFLVGKE